MQALRQEVFIPKHHKLEIKVPNDLPTGYAELFLIYKNIDIKNTEKITNKLDKYIGTWQKDNAFDEAVAQFDQIDKDIWK